MARGKYQEWLKPEGLLKIEGWARDGLTDEQIAHNMGISRDTLITWKKKYSDISDTLKRGKDVVDRIVENALFESAKGHPVEEIIEDYDEYGNLKSKRRVVKQIPPNVTAIIFYLKNRKPEEWRDKRDIGLSGAVETTNPYEDLTTDELKKLIRNG